MDGLLRFLVTSYWGAALFFLIGVLAIFDAIRNPQDMSDPFLGTFKMWVGGIGSIILSFIILYSKLTAS